MPKVRTPKTAKVVAMPSVDIPFVPTHRPDAVEHDDIARRAFGIFCERGSQPGHDLEDWLQAERELRTLARGAVA